MKPSLDINKPLTIQKFPDYPETMDYKGLVQAFMLACQKYSGRLWTDYNIHDPGVTIFEMLSLCITELGLKSDQDIFRIIFHAERENFDPVEYALYGPLEVFPTQPVTICDYRKYLIDKFVNSVENIWIEPVHFTESGMHYKGLVNILVKPKIDSDKHKIEKEVKKCFLDAKNMGEDLGEVIILQPAIVTIILVAVVKGDFLPEEVLAELRQLIYNDIERPVSSSSYLSRIQDGEAVEDVLSGPFLESGMIDDASLDNSGIEQTKVLYKSRLFHSLSKSPKIERIESLQLYIDKELVETDNVEFQPYMYPHFDFHASDIYLYKNDNLLSVNDETQEYIFKSTYHRKKVYSTKSLTEYLRPDFVTSIDVRDIHFFYSMQNQFPPIYGISDYGQARREPKFVASSLQLKAYLAFFEQIMKNYLTQLANVNKLFSINRVHESTYYTALPEEIPYLDHVLKVKAGDYSVLLEQINDLFDPRFYRRDLFMNHLLARFGESINYSNIHAVNRESSVNEYERYQKDTAMKSLFLKNYVVLSKNRSKSRIDLDIASGIISSFHLKILILLGFKDLKFRKTTGLNNFQESHGGGMKYTFNGDDDVRMFFSSIINPGNYHIREKGTKNDLIFIDARGKEFSLVQSRSFSECEAALNLMADRGRALNQYSEYFHIVENIELRPDKESLTTDDPFSNICSVIIPDWPDRFQEQSFQNNFKSLVRQHAPVHIKFNFYWLSYTEMVAFEELFVDFVESRGNAKNTLRKDALRKFLFEL